MANAKRTTLSVEPGFHGWRLDRFLSTIDEIGSRARASRIIDEFGVYINGKPAKASSPIKTNDQIDLHIPLLIESTTVEPWDHPIQFLHEDEDLVVVNKPAGIPVHPSAGHPNKTLVNILVGKIPNLAMGFGEHRPGIIHRIDKDTSGLLVVAKNNFSQQQISQQFQERTTHRIYQALLHGSLKKNPLHIQSFLARHPLHRKKFASVRTLKKEIIIDENKNPGQGKWAVTFVDGLVEKFDLSFVKIKLKTGRTHQIRVHLSEAGHPLVGDSLYGAEKKIKNISKQELRSQLKDWPRFFLHARELGFRHPRTQELLNFEAEWPENDLIFLKDWGFIK